MCDYFKQPLFCEQPIRRTSKGMS